MKRYIAILSLCLSVSLCACGAAPEKSVPDAGGPAKKAVYESPDAYGEIPELGAETEDFSTLAGTWHADEGGAILTIYGNGGFELNEAEDTCEGSLVYTDADGDLWESGPRYELYLENNERVPNCYFALDEAHPGKLVYAVGGGAELFSRGDSAYDDAGIVVRVQWDNGTWTDCDEFTAYSGDYEVGIVFSASRTLRDFKVLSVSLEDVDEDGTPVFSVLELYTQDALTPERPLLVHTSFPGDMPTNGISYLDGDGTTRYFSVNESGFDGSLILSEFARSDTP